MKKTNKIISRSNALLKGRNLKSHKLRFSTLTAKTRTPYPGAKSNVAISNSQRNDLVGQLKVVNKKVNNSIAILSQKRIDSSIATKTQTLSTILDQIMNNLDRLNTLYSDHVITDKPKGKSLLQEKLVKSGKFTEEEAKEFLKK